jgi:hypothetical protein
MMMDCDRDDGEIEGDDQTINEQVIELEEEEDDESCLLLRDFEEKNAQT